MEKAYSMLSPGRAGDWGNCLLIKESLGSIISGEKEVDTLEEELILLLRNEDTEGDITPEDMEEISETVYGQDNINGDIYYFLNNRDLDDYVIKFYDIADYANYVRENNIEIIGNLE